MLVEGTVDVLPADHLRRVGEEGGNSRRKKPDNGYCREDSPQVAVVSPLATPLSTSGSRSSTSPSASTTTTGTNGKEALQAGRAAPVAVTSAPADDDNAVVALNGNEGHRVAAIVDGQILDKVNQKAHRLAKPPTGVEQAEVVEGNIKGGHEQVTGGQREDERICLR